VSLFFFFILSGTGLWISFYFTGVYYRWFKPDVNWIPQVCRLEEKSCLTVLGTPRAKFFGLPNSVFGLAAYPILMLDAAWLDMPQVSLFLVLAMLGRSIYLAYSLLFITRIPCPLCFTTHAVNALLFLLCLIRLF
jgi:uncharacterized membrane protein